MRRIRVTWVFVSIFCIVLMISGGITSAAYSDPTTDNQMTISDIANNIDIINGSTNTPPADYVPVRSAPSGNTLGMLMTASAASQSGGSKALLVEDVLPWGYPSNEYALNELGITYDVFGSSSLATTDLSKYEMVIIASDQQTWTYNNLASNKDKFASYVYNGGVLVAHATDEGWNAGHWSSSFLPGGVTHVNNINEYLSIVDSSSPIVSGITDAELDGWHYSTHGYFANIPADAHIIIGITGNPTGYPTYIEYSYGSGKVLATIETIEWPWKRVADGATWFNEQKNLLRNEFKYASGLSGTNKALEYVPNLWFDSEEKYYPTSPFFYTDDIMQTSGEKSKNNYLNLSFAEKMDKATIYYHTVDTGSEIVYEYWFYYPYNDFMNKHYHDWESVFVFTDKATGKVDKVAASAHEWYIPNNVLDNPGKDHMGILVEEGSHASAIDKNDDGIADFSDVSNAFIYGVIVNRIPPSTTPFILPFAYQTWGFGRFYPYLWSSGAKITHDASYLKVIEITDDFIGKFDGMDTFPNSPDMGTPVYIPVPFVEGDRVVNVGGAPPKHPWDQQNYNEPYKILTSFKDLVSVVAKDIYYREVGGAIVIIMSDQTYYTFTNETGYCIIANVTPGIHEVVVNADDYSPYVQRFDHEGNTSLGVNGTLFLVPTPEAYRIQGIVTDVKGNIMANSTVNIYDENGTMVYTTLTDENGTYITTGSSKHTYTVEALYGNKTAEFYNLSGKPGSTVDVNLTVAYPSIWANSTITQYDAIRISGGKNLVNGTVHSNDGIKISGSGNVLNGTTEYSSHVQSTGSKNIYSPVKIPSKAMPLQYTVEDYEPGGVKALSAEASGKYHFIDGDLKVSGTSSTLDGLYYVTGNVTLSGNKITGTFTIIADGRIDVSGSGYNCTSYADDILFFSNDSIKTSGSKSIFNGTFYTLSGEIGVSGSMNTINGGIMGNTIRLSGSRNTINAT
ncbi:carboxypeptidase regulatory-like domain-containing protein [Methanocella conradii]|uniref:carboxypeptidase regulatory-like domain-containing protein n=1 Tax=Methanocella conradii TaxID=1175444 RepID=UPI0024B394E2|nr:carboxypeptidase regulatory-like domain-containing protein [Methanocella conradii]MDI6896675.1 carboxypeptidase regulatory-like domain-containing protein [Methanocella conradii]